MMQSNVARRGRMKQETKLREGEGRGGKKNCSRRGEGWEKENPEGCKGQQRGGKDQVREEEAQEAQERVPDLPRLPFESLICLISADLRPVC